MPKLVHPELSYQVRGVLFDVYNIKNSFYSQFAVVFL